MLHLLIRQSGRLHLIKIPGRRQERKITAEQDFIHPDQFYCQAVNIRIIQIGRGGRIKVHSFQALLDFLFKKTEKKQAAAPVSQNNVVLWKRVNQLIDLYQRIGGFPGY